MENWNKAPTFALLNLTTTKTVTMTTINTNWTKAKAERPGVINGYRFAAVTGIGAHIYLDERKDGYYVSYGELVRNHKVKATSPQEAKKKALAIVDTAITGMITKPWAQITEANHVTQTRYVGYKLHISRGCVIITTERKGKRITYDAPLWHFFQHEQAQGAITNYSVEDDTVTLHKETAEDEDVKRTLWMPKYFELSFAEDAVEGYFRTHIRKE